MTIVDRIGPEPVYEQLAEECCELSQAALKMARYLRGVNPPAKDLEELKKDLIEEVTDVKICLVCLGLSADEELAETKFARWHMRLDLAQWGSSDEGY